MKSAWWYTTRMRGSEPSAAYFSMMRSLQRSITDPSNGYRATRPEILTHLSLEQDQFWASEVLIEALRMRARITEVPITIQARRAGQSKKPKSLKYGWHFAKAIVKTWLR